MSFSFNFVVAFVSLVGHFRAFVLRGRLRIL